MTPHRAAKGLVLVAAFGLGWWLSRYCLPPPPAPIVTIGMSEREAQAIGLLDIPPDHERCPDCRVRVDVYDDGGGI